MQLKTLCVYVFYDLASVFNELSTRWRWLFLSYSRHNKLRRRTSLFVLLIMCNCNNMEIKIRTKPIFIYVGTSTYDKVYFNFPIYGLTNGIIT